MVNEGSGVRWSVEPFGIAGLVLFPDRKGIQWEIYLGGNYVFSVPLFQWCDKASKQFSICCVCGVFLFLNFIPS